MLFSGQYSYNPPENGQAVALVIWGAVAGWRLKEPESAGRNHWPGRPEYTINLFMIIHQMNLTRILKMLGTCDIYNNYVL
jgi:hypothetical protein